MTENKGMQRRARASMSRVLTRSSARRKPRHPPVNCGARSIISAVHRMECCSSVESFFVAGWLLLQL